MATPSGILHWLVLHSFLNEAQAQELQRIGDPEELTRELTERGWLTRYQAHQILLDKADSLILGPYRLMEVIGEGAMGQVFKAYSTRLERLVAVKMIHKEHLASKKA